MKTIEEKAKAYDEAIEKAKVMHEEGMMTERLEYLFPELKESEDEKIRKELVSLVLNAMGREKNSFSDDKYDSMLAWLEKQGQTFTKKDVDDAYLKGVCDTKQELEKQGKNTSKWELNTEDNKPSIKHSVLMKTADGVAEGEWQGDDLWYQYRWCSRIKDSDVLAWMELSDLKGINYGMDINI